MSNPSSSVEFETFGELLRHLRRRAGLTQRDLGQAVGYSEAHITRLENGQRLPDLTAVKGSFVEALDLKHEPELARHLVELAAKARGDMPRVTVQNRAKARTNLSVQLTSFIGREREMAEVSDLLGKTRLLTLIGAGGVGKTRLAQEVAAGLLDKFPEGIWCVELAALSNSALVPQTVAATLKLTEQSGRPPLDVVADYFAGQQALLILDNCEHLIAVCADLAVHLLQRCPGLRLLATSRETLRVPSEVVYRVPSLTTPPPAHEASDLSMFDSVRLFVERACVAKPSFALTSDNTADIAQICRRLDGIPLALELAAARLKLLPINQIAKRLDDRFDLLTSGVRTALPRHRTLRATIAWSVDLLTPSERELLARLSVFAGGFTAEAVEATFEQSNLLDLLSNLVDKSLIIADVRADRVRYHMLETIRQYAHELLQESSELEQTRDQHLAFLLRLGERAEPELRRADQIAWLDRLEAELDNIRAALEWSLENERHIETALRLATALMWFWHNRDHRREGSNWLERALFADAQLRSVDLSFHTRTLARANALNAAGFLVDGYSRPIAYAEEGLALSRGLGDAGCPSMAFAWWILACAARMQPNYDYAQSLLEKSLALYQKVEDKFGVAECLVWLGDCALMKGNYGRAMEIQEEGLALRQEIGDKDGMATAYRYLGKVAFWHGDLNQAATLYGMGLELAYEVGSKKGVNHSLTRLARVNWAQGNYRQALSQTEQSLALAHEIGDQSAVALSHYCLGGIKNSQGEYGQAAWHFEQALTRFRHLGDINMIAVVQCDLGSIALAQDEYVLPTKRFEEALAIGHETGDHSTISNALFGQGQVAQATSDFASAYARYKEALALRRMTHDQWAIAFVLDATAAVAVAQGQALRAAWMYGASERLYDVIRYMQSPFERHMHEQGVESARSQLDEAKFAAAWAEGKQMTLEQAIEYALGDREESSIASP